MHKEIVQVKSLEEIESILFQQSDDYYFIDQEIKSVEHKNSIKSLGARYLIKKTILDHLNLHDEFDQIEIENEETGKPFVTLKSIVKTKADEMKIKDIKVSISHSRNYITTLVVFE